MSFLQQSRCQLLRGYLAHHTGGAWQRIFYHQANSLDALLDASEAIQGGGDDDGADDAAADEDKGPSFAERGWSSHVVGGKFRKLQTITAADHKTLLAARGEAISALYDENDEAGNEFSEICGPHVDYMWNIVHESK